jgi:uncharacterized protein
VQGMDLSVADLLGRPGEYRDFSLTPKLTGLRHTLAEVTDEPLTATFRAESVVEGILVTGTVTAPTALRCARCLRSFDHALSLELCELFVAPGHEDSADSDAYRVSGKEIHLEAMLRDAVSLAIPVNPVCRPDCRGLCARCGANLNEGSCTCVEDEVDPRWAPLDELRARLGGS